MAVEAEPRAGAGTTTAVVTTREAFDALRAEWSDLLAHASAPDELQHDPAVVGMAISRMEGALGPRFVVVRAGGRVRAIAPFYLQDTRVPLRLSVVQLASVRARALRMFGDRPIVHRDEDPAVVFEAMFERLREMRREFDLIWIYTQRLDEPLWSFLQSETGRRLPWKPVVTSGRAEKLHRLRFDRTFEEYLAGVRTKPGFPGKTIRRFWRDQRDRCAVVRIGAPDDVRTLVDGIDRVYNLSWQARTYGARRRNSEPEAARLRALAALGYLRSYLLTEEGVPIAFVLGYQYRGRYVYDETGYDPDRSSFSPGSVLTHAVIEDLFRENTPRELDFGFGDGAYKRTFGNDTGEVCSLYLARTARWRAILAAQRSLASADDRLRAVVTKAGLAARVRRLLKRQGKRASS